MQSLQDGAWTTSCMGRIQMDNNKICRMWRLERTWKYLPMPKGVRWHPIYKDRQECFQMQSIRSSLRQRRLRKLISPKSWEDPHVLTIAKQCPSALVPSKKSLAITPLEQHSQSWQDWQCHLDSIRPIQISIQTQLEWCLNCKMRL